MSWVISQSEVWATRAMHTPEPVTCKHWWDKTAPACFLLYLNSVTRNWLSTASLGDFAVTGGCLPSSVLTWVELTPHYTYCLFLLIFFFMGRHNFTVAQHTDYLISYSLCSSLISYSNSHPAFSSVLQNQIIAHYFLLKAEEASHTNSKTSIPETPLSFQ